MPSAFVGGPWWLAVVAALLFVSTAVAYVRLVYAPGYAADAVRLAAGRTPAAGARSCLSRCVLGADDSCWRAGVAGDVRGGQRRGLARAARDRPISAMAYVPSWFAADRGG